MAATLLIVSITVLRLTGILSDTIWTATLRSGGVANVHGLFRLVPAIILLPFSGQMQKLAVKIRAFFR